MTATGVAPDQLNSSVRMPPRKTRHSARVIADTGPEGSLEWRGPLPTPDGYAVSSRDTALAVLLRKAEWLLDEAAFEVGGGRYSDQQRREPATALDELSATLREPTDDAVPTTIDVEQSSGTLASEAEVPGYRSSTKPAAAKSSSNANA